MKAKLIPLKYDFIGKTGKHFDGYEKVLLEYDGCPETVFHVDLLWNDFEHTEIHKRLCDGETVDVEIQVRDITPRDEELQ